MRASVESPDNAQTLNAAALLQLRSDIISCRLAPSERLRVETLRERYGMGTSPIREALMRLEAEGLVELEQNKGFRVSEVSHENLSDLMRTRIGIEDIALRWSIENGGVDWEANLLSAFHRLSRQAKIDPAFPDVISDAWWTEHANFHAALVAGCDAPTLLTIRTRLFEQAERYVALSIMSRGLLRDDVGEHRQLMQTTINRNIEKALDLNRAHINRTYEKVAAALAGSKKIVKVRAVRNRSKK